MRYNAEAAYLLGETHLIFLKMRLKYGTLFKEAPSRLKAGNRLPCLSLAFLHQPMVLKPLANRLIIESE